MRNHWLLALPLLVITACAEPPAPTTVPDGFGEAVRHNIEVQIAAPEREIDSLGAAPGVRRGRAIERYQTDQVESPVEVDTRTE